jgi:hypothetical protein
LHNARTNPERPADLKDAIALSPQFFYSRLDRRIDPTMTYRRRKSVAIAA